MPESSDHVVCEGGPEDGDVCLGWASPDDTMEVYELPAGHPATRSLNIDGRPLLWGIWASLMTDGAPADAAYLGHYRLDLAKRRAVWVPAE